MARGWYAAAPAVALAAFAWWGVTYEDPDRLHCPDSVVTSGVDTQGAGKNRAFETPEGAAADRAEPGTIVELGRRSSEQAQVLVRRGERVVADAQVVLLRRGWVVDRWTVCG